MTRFPSPRRGSRATVRRAAVWCALVYPVATAMGQTPKPSAVLFENVRVFDGTAALTPATNVLIVGDTIATISRGPITPPAGDSVIRIAGGGRTLMPGLIDAHWHSSLAALPVADLLTADLGYVELRAGREATKTLLRGFTSVRDAGGPIFGLKRAIDEQIIAGPRIWPSGAFITQSGGHFDFRLPTEIPAAPNRSLYRFEIDGAAMIADSPDEVRQRAREQLMLGASQIKLAAGGGVSSHYDPLDVTQFTEDEMRAAVEAAENWGTYVMVHAYTPRAIQMAIRAGVKCIEHGQLVDDETAKIMAAKGIWWSLQPFLDDSDANAVAPVNRLKKLQMVAGTDKAYALAKKYKIKTAWGSDILFSGKLAGRQGALLTKLVRWYTPAEVLKMATADNAQLLALSGLRSPYQGTLGVVQTGALADLLLVDGNPLENIKLIEDPEKNFLVIMKGGQIAKNAVGQ
jgi:imidazolonepropionase-like amidohydrolase